ncbi:MAG: PHP domain-containing protein, partial [Chloroflexi bacterium]|nr:PHP domain-containing protein [Chloroflexota bacterium]
MCCQASRGRLLALVSLWIPGFVLGGAFPRLGRPAGTGAGQAGLAGGRFGRCIRLCGVGALEGLGLSLVLLQGPEVVLSTWAGTALAARLLAPLRAVQRRIGFIECGAVLVRLGIGHRALLVCVGGRDGTACMTLNQENVCSIIEGMATRYAELHGHSNFSFLDGASGADDLVERAVELGLSALAVTDHQGLYGAVRFSSAAAEAGLHAVIGMEIELLDTAVPGAAWQETGGTASSGVPTRPRAERRRVPARRAPKREDLRGVRTRELGQHLVLLAKDGAGYSSLCRIASAAHLAGTKGVPRFTHDLLAQHADGLIALTGCRHGEIPRRLLAGDRQGAAAAARRLAGLFGSKGSESAGSNLLVELQHHLLPDDDWLVAELVRLAEEIRLPVVVTNDVHYARPEDRELQDVLVGIRHGLTLDESAHLRRPNGEYHLKSEAELRALPPGLPDADPNVRRAWQSGISLAGDVAARCHVELGFERYRFPGYPVPRGETPFSYLETLCHDGARRRYQPMTSPVVKQLAHELDVIERTGLAEFFLICWDLMRFCGERGIPAQGRGSAGDSVVAYVLGITRVDPIRHRLLFERFINEGRTSYPDVDIDFASSRREEVIQYVYERYGPEHTGMVCNVVTYRARSAVREVGYALGFPRPLVDRVAKALETYDSVMVRRDLEAEGGFAEFFQAAGEGTVGVGGDGAGRSGSSPGSSPAAGRSLARAVAESLPQANSESLPQAVAAAAATEASRMVGERAAAMGFIDGMGQLGHGRGGRLATGGAGEHGTGRMARREDERRVDNGGPIRGPSAVSAAGAVTTGAIVRLSDRLMPRTELRRGPSDDEGGPGDTPVSVRWLRGEGSAGAREAELTVSAEAGPTVRATRRIKASSVGYVELDPLPPPSPSRSTVGLSPWDRWLELCARIDGFPRHLSIHTGGMLITAAPLVDIAPLERATMPGRVVVQYDKRDVETIKLIKLDLLGLRMLSAIDDALRDISVDCAVHVDLDRLPEDIPEVFRMIQAADTVGVFQIESRAQMQTLPRSRPEDLDDLVVEVAIIRPGPIQGNAVHPYLRRKQGLEPVTYLHPSLEPILSETLGVILYQEQVMKVAIDVAGFSAADSDGFRRAMGTWRSNREMEKLHARFVDGCVARSGLTPEEAEELFRQAAAFASFGFNKSHAAAFARTAYESAFLKLFYPAQFVTGLINAQPMGFYPVEVLINDAKRHGVCILPVDVNRSRYRSTTEWVGLPGERLPQGAGIDRRPA